MINLKSHFWYNNRQRNGIFFLLLLIVIFQGIYFFVDFSSDEKNKYNSSNEIALFQHEIDSLKLIEIEKRKPKLYPFNPSFITDYKGYKLGMSTQEIDRILAHRNKGLYINSAKQFQSVTKISDSLLALLSPQFKFPDWINKKKTYKKKYSKIDTSESLNIAKQDLNTVSIDNLRDINGIGDKLSARIVKYRTSINGFQNDNQLAKVYGLKPEVIEKILQRYTVLTKLEIIKVNINIATFKEVLHLPYIDYELTKKIFQYRDEVAEIQDINELKNIVGFPMESFDKIALYLEAE